MFILFVHFIEKQKGFTLTLVQLFWRTLIWQTWLFHEAIIASKSFIEPQRQMTYDCMLTYSDRAIILQLSHIARILINRPTVRTYSSWGQFTVFL